MIQVLRGPDTPTLKAIYNLHNHVKQYGKKTNENYRRRSRHGKSTARQNSSWKDAIYAVETRALNLETRALKELLRENTPETVEKHRISRDDP